MKTCSMCHKQIEKPDDNFSSGHGIDIEGNIFCYPCCAIKDKATMRKNGSITLYLTKDKDGTWSLTNFPASLSFKPTVIRGRHNWGIKRYDCWFIFEGFIWWGVKYGDNSDLAYCKKTKQKSRYSLSGSFIERC